MRISDWSSDVCSSDLSNTRVTAADWAHLSTEWRNELDDRIARLTRLRDQMSSCIGCGCLAIDECPLRNPYDELSEQGSGPRLLDPEIGCASCRGSVA